jgi:DNA-binding transcriptional LysR family regulator
MELHHLQTFIIVAEEQSITRAAKRLYTTPSTISMHIKALEDELGVDLFTRTNHGMTITAKGELLRQKALLTLRAAQDLVNHATDLQQTLIGTVAIGLCSDPPLLKIPALIQRLHQDYPGIDLTLHHFTSAHIIDALLNHQLALGFVFGPVDQPLLIVQPLTQVELVVAIPAAWPSTVDAGGWQQLAEQPWVSVGRECPFQSLMEAHLHTQGLICRHRVQIDDDRSRYQLVQAGLGLSLLEQAVAQQGVAAGALRIAPVPAIACPLSLVYRAHEQHQPLVRTLRTIIGGLFSVDS